ncbi:O-antigen ligase family protein [Micromonospora sp. NPDC049679]|uniref:O-antigen ligase family protein n=1 Tax=Micromonospora sp. NPDC049679 TaxID=3155920 RepID=UPI0033D95D28
MLFLALPQLYLLPEGSIDIALTTIVTALLLPAVSVGVKRSPDRRLFGLGLFRVLVALLAVRLLALVWSPEPRAGLQSIVLLGQFIVTLMLMWEAVRQDPDLLRHVQRVYWPWVALEAGLVILFRVQPAVEAMFLRSIGGVFIGENTIADFFGDKPNNVFDVAKSGGVFINANVAAMFLGVSGLAALAVASVTHTRWVRLVGIAALVSVPFTGSKSATILALALPAIAFGVTRMNRAATVVRRHPLILAGSLGMAVVLLLYAANRGLLVALSEALLGRTVMWGFGAKSFQDTPILGLGYGGWDAGFTPYAADYGLHRSFPPHNLLLAAWSSTGIPGLVLTVIFFALAFWLFVRGLSRRFTCDKSFVSYAGAAVGWILIQGMGENTDIFGEIHLIPIVSLLIAYLIRNLGEELKESATHAHRRHRATPAIPAVGDVHRQPGVGTAQLPPAVRGEGPGPDHARGRLG